MKRSLIWIFWAALAAGLFSCSTLKVSQDYDQTTDFSTFKTFAWQEDIQPKTGDIRVDSPLIDQRVRESIKTNLANRGMEYSGEDLPDFKVAYTYTILTKIQSTPATTGVGIGIGTSGGLGGIGMRTGSDIREYDQGLLVIDFLSPDTGKLWWRGTSTRVVSTHATPDGITEDIETTVARLLEQFPPKK